jgi:hypothetical protein
VAKPVIDFRKQDGLTDAGVVLEGDELHRVAVLPLRPRCKVCGNDNLNGYRSR